MGAVPPFDAMARRVGRLSEAGMRSFWWPDHLMGVHSAELWASGGLASLQPDPHTYADPFVCMAACAAAAGHARLGVCVTDAIRRMPATLAQTAMTLDHLAPGRVVLGLGSGEYANYGPYGVEMASPAARLEQAAQRIRRFLDGPGPDEDGAVLGLRPPPGSPGPQLWLAAHGPRGYVAAGRWADGWIPHFLAADAWNAAREAVAAAAREAGRDAAAITYALSLQVVIQGDHDAAHQLLENPILKAYALLLPAERFAAVGTAHPLGGSGLRHLVATRAAAAQRAAAGTVPFEVVHGHILHGTAEEVADALGAYRGLDHVVLWDPVSLVDLAAGKASAAACVRLASALHGEPRP